MFLPQMAIAILSILIFPLALAAQTSADKKLREREEKLELIMRLQDRRSLDNGKLINFISDAHSLVRERAVLAFGSIQDTSVIPLLEEALTDVDFNVQESSAFAIGQTAGQLCSTSLQAIQHRLVWSRLDDSRAADRMIEEVGKFGTEEALNDLISRFGIGHPLLHTEAMMMSIARFAIRGVISISAVRYLLQFIKPAEAAPWQAVYALQRIGNHEETRHELEHIVRLKNHENPLVRMHLATLLGKIRDEKTSLEPLQKLAEFDRDSRVRINAFKALSNFDLRGHDDLIGTFKRAFSDGNPHVALVALSAFGNSGLKQSDSSEVVKETFLLLKRMAENTANHYLWQTQGEAAVALAKLEGEAALPFVRLTNWPQPLLQAQMLTAIAYTGASEAESILSGFLESRKHILYRAALGGLQILSQKTPNDSALIQRTYEASLGALRAHDVSVATTAAAILGDSLFRRSASVDPLLETLSGLRLPDDVEAMQEIISTLGKIKDVRSVQRLQSFLWKSDRSVALASASALKSITGLDHQSALPKSFEPLFTDFDFAYLRSLPDTVLATMETIRGNVVMELYKSIAPFTVMSFLKLATQRGFYRGSTFHRVVPNFVVQGGDPRGDGWGGPGYSLRSEFSALSFDVGAVGMASAGKDTEGSQFFITHSPQPHLDGRYTMFGRVIAGMEVVDRLQVDDRLFDIKPGR